MKKSNYRERRKRKEIFFSLNIDKISLLSACSTSANLQHESCFMEVKPDDQVVPVKDNLRLEQVGQCC